MRRRTLLGVPLALWPTVGGAEAGRVMTVRGAVAPEELGLTLPHEHLFSLFGADPMEPPRYDEARLLAAVEPALASVRRLGVRSVVDCTAAYFGREPGLLRRLSERSGLHLVTNTGYYRAAEDRYVPAHARSETADQLAARWVAEFRDGIGGTEVRPGFLKIGVDPGTLSGVDRTLVQAAARAHRRTGLPIAVHTGNSPVGAREQLAVLKGEGISPENWIWVHANACTDEAALDEAAAAGAWLSFDGLDAATLDRHLRCVKRMQDQGRLGQVLLSHDGNSFRAQGRPPRPYEALLTEFIPRLRSAGFREGEIRQLTTDNPQRAFTLRRVTSQETKSP